MSSGQIVLVGRDETVGDIKEHLRRYEYGFEHYREIGQFVERLREVEPDVLLIKVCDFTEEHIDHLRRHVETHSPPTRTICLLGELKYSMAMSLLQMPYDVLLRLPQQIEDLPAQVREQTMRARLLRSIHRDRTELHESLGKLRQLDSLIRQRTHNSMTLSIRTYLGLVFSQISGYLKNTYSVCETIAGAGGDMDVCNFLDCPRLERMYDDLRHARDVLDSTRKSFKSKELAQLRQRLEKTLAAMDKMHPQEN